MSTIFARWNKLRHHFRRYPTDNLTEAGVRNLDICRKCLLRQNRWLLLTRVRAYHRMELLPLRWLALQTRSHLRQRSDSTRRLIHNSSANPASLLGAPNTLAKFPRCDHRHNPPYLPRRREIHLERTVKNSAPADPLI